MVRLSWSLCLLLSCFGTLTQTDSKHLPRITLSAEETSVKRLSLPRPHAPVRILLQRQPDTVTAVGQTHLYTYVFREPLKAPAQRTVRWKDCGSQKDCSFNITVVHERQENDQAFVCGTNGKETVCCDMNLSAQSPLCNSSERTEEIRNSIRTFIVKGGEHSALVETESGEDLYITYSGSQRHVGIHKFGNARVGPSKQDKEQHYVGLMLSRQQGRPSQDKVYAFYKEKNTDKDLNSEMWLPFVTQVCMNDIGGPKNNLQFKWTSQLNARLFCGNADSKQHFSELVDVATVHAERWYDTRVYALFRNEWNMSAICVYTIQNIDYVFKNSPFKDNHMNRSRTCVSDSRKIHHETLRMIEKTSEMENWVQPVHKSGQLLFNYESYTHIYTSSSQYKSNDQHTVLFLSLSNGAIHKVIHTGSQALVITEHHPFSHRALILSTVLQPSYDMLYVNSRSELAQLNVADCTKYGDRCEDCVLARDPYCSWNGTHCTHETPYMLQNVTTGNYTICHLTERVLRYSSDTQAGDTVKIIKLPSQSKYFAQCPVSSKHAQYTWRHHENSTHCRSKNHECLLLIDSMGPEQEGVYSCVSEELGYRKVLAQFELQLDNRAASPLSSPRVWVCLITALLVLMSPIKGDI